MAEDKYFVLPDGQNKIGPISRSQVEAMLTRKTLKPSTPIWKEGLEDWTTCGELEEFKEWVAPEPPPFRAKESSAPPRAPNSPPPKVGKPTSSAALGNQSAEQKSIPFKVIAVAAGIGLAGFVFVVILVRGILPPMFGPKAAVYDYFEADNVAERYEMTCKSNQISVDDMKRIYGDADFNYRAVNLEIDGDVGDKRVKNVEVTYKDLDSGKTFDTWYWVHKKDGGWCVSWFAENDMRIERSFSELYHDGGSALAFVGVALSDYYNYAYGNAHSTHYSLEIIGTGKNAYIAKNEPGAREIFDRLKNGGTCRIRCNLRYPYGARSDDILTANDAELVKY